MIRPKKWYCHVKNNREKLLKFYEHPEEALELEQCAAFVERMHDVSGL